MIGDAGERLRGAGVLVTGGLGFLGGHLVGRLRAEGAEVSIVDTATGPARRDVELLPLDVRSPEFGELVSDTKFDLIFHLAANAYVPPSVEHPDIDYRLNLDATFGLLESMRRCSSPTRLIFFSSAAVYGEPARLPISEEDPTVPNSPYGVSKLAAERYLAVYCQLYGLSAASMRLFSAYGPGQRKQIVFDFIDKLSRSPERLEMLGDGTQSRDLLYADDVASAAVVVAERGALAGEVYNVASGSQVSTLELAHLVSKAMDLRPEIGFSGAVRPGDPQRWRASTERIQGLGFRPIVPLDLGIARTLEWYRSALAG